MSIFIRFLSLIILLFSSFSALAQQKFYKYRMEGAYPAILPGLSAPRTIRFILVWNEKDQFIEGVYQDDFFSNRASVSGTVGVNSRVFRIPLSRIVQGVSSLSLTSNVPLTTGTMTGMIFMRDATNMNVSQANISPSVLIRDDEPQEVSLCDVGFGILSGYCGLYKGSFTETSDTKNLCNLPNYGFGLQLNTDANMNLYFYYSDSTVGIPTHSLGSFQVVPISSGISMMNRNCGALVGTSFNPESCQVLSLNGIFSEVAGARHFTGRYTITEEVTGESCSHDISVERELGY